MFLRFDGQHVPLIEVDPIDRDFNKQEIARVFVKRDLLDEDDVEQGQTEMLVVETESTDDEDAEFGGVLRNIDRKGSASELIVESFERYARDALPTPGGERWENVEDTVIVEDALDNVPQIEAGTIENVGSDPITMVFSHSSQARKIREVAKAVGAEIRYNPDRTLDFLDRRGSDRTDEVELSPGQQNIKGDFEADKISGDEDITHLRAVGAGEGQNQQQVNFVPEDDSTDWENDDGLDNVIRYEADHWDDGDRFEWTVKADKDQVDVSGLESLGWSIIEDVQTEEVEVSTKVEGVDLLLGDTVTVNYPEEQVNEQPMRVVELEEQVDSEGVTDTVVLSTRREARVGDQEQEDREDLGSYNMAFEGTNVTETAGPYEDAVDPDNNIDWVMNYYYPDEVEYEHRVKLHLTGRAYRAKSRGAASSGGSHSHSVSISSHSHSVEYGVPFHVHSLNTDEPTTSFDGTHDHGGEVGSDGGHSHDYDRATGIGGPSDNDTKTTTSEDGGGTTTTSSSTTPSHSHDPEPGVIEFNEYPGEVEVVVNGTTVATGIGESEGSWDEEVDLAGELVPGTRNTIRIEADSIGEIVGQLDVDVYRQILGDG